MTTPDLSAIIARLRRAQPRNPDTLAACDALEGFLRAPRAIPFDKPAYQRTYMRDARAAKKLGISTAEYRKRD